MEEEIQDVAADTSAEEIVEPIQQDSNEDAWALQERLEAAEKAKSQLTARAKKAEEELKALKAKPQVNINNNDPQLIDELFLVADGLKRDELEQAKVIARGKGISLTEAIKDPLFTIYQEDFRKKEKREYAKLGASKGSGETQEEVTGLQSGSTRDDHKKAVEKILGKK